MQQEYADPKETEMINRKKSRKKFKEDGLSKAERDKRKIEVPNAKKDFPVYWRHDLDIPGENIAAEITLDEETHIVVPAGNFKKMVLTGTYSTCHMTGASYDTCIGRNMLTVHTVNIVLNNVLPESIKIWKEREFENLESVKKRILLDRQFRIEQTETNTRIVCKKKYNKKIIAALFEKTGERWFEYRSSGLILHCVRKTEEIENYMKIIQEITILKEREG